VNIGQVVEYDDDEPQFIQLIRRDNDSIYAQLNNEKTYISLDIDKTSARIILANNTVDRQTMADNITKLVRELFYDIDLPNYYEVLGYMKRLNSELNQ